MKKIMPAKVLKIATAAALASLMLSCSIKQVEYSKRTVNVHGTGSVTINADMATITLSVITRGNDVSTAATDNSIRMNEVQASLQREGIAKDCFSTENYSVYQESSYDKGKTVLGDYRVTNQIKIVVKNIDNVCNVIDTALKAGANQLSSLQYGVSNTDIAVKQARTLAVQQAQEAAVLIAGTTGAKVGKVLKITEQANYDFPRSVMMKASVMSDSNSESMATPVSSGKSTITVNIDATFELN